MHNFDRGIIKWLPFDALTGYKNAILKLKEKREKIKEPILSIDQIEILNKTLNNAVRNMKNVRVYYYQKGLIYYLVGQIKKVDYIYKKINIDDLWLTADSIVEITIE